MGNNCDNYCLNSNDSKSEIKTEKTLNTNFESSNNKIYKFN